MNIHFLLPGSINSITGISAYEKQIADGLKSKGHSVTIHSIGTDFPFASKESIDECKKIFSLVPENVIMIVDGKTLPAIPSFLKKLSKKRRLVGLIHLPMSLNPEFTAYQREIITKPERDAISTIPKIVASSLYTKNLLIEIGIEASKIKAIHPGVRHFPQKPTYATKPTKLLCVADFTRSKDYTLLVRSLTALKERNWIMDCFGDLDQDRNYLADLQALIRRSGLKDRVLIHAPLCGNELSNAYLNADLFIHPSGFETNGMALTEALSHGLPVVASTGGGIAKSVPQTMGKFFKPRDIYGLVTVLELLLENASSYNKLCIEAASYHTTAQTWEQSVDQFEEFLENSK